MGLFNFLFGRKKKELESTNKKVKDDLLEEATSALEKRDFPGAIEIYQKLADDNPKYKGLYLSQIGALFYFLNDHDKVMEYNLIVMQKT